MVFVDEISNQVHISTLRYNICIFLFCYQFPDVYNLEDEIPSVPEAARVK